VQEQQCAAVPPPGSRRVAKPRLAPLGGSDANGTGAQSPRFVPQQALLESASFSVFFKFLAVSIVTLAALWAWQMWSQGMLEATLRSSGWLAAALAMMAFTEWHILRGKTRLTVEALEQSWVWRKRVVLNELAYAKLVRVAGLDWLIAPRLYTRTFGNKLTVIYVTGPAMLAEMQKLERHVQTSVRP
jgi:hypothetical protein